MQTSTPCRLRKGPVPGALHHNVVIDMDLGLLPLPQLESFCRKGPQAGLSISSKAVRDLPIPCMGRLFSFTSSTAMASLWSAKRRKSGYGGRQVTRRCAFKTPFPLLPCPGLPRACGTTAPCSGTELGIDGLITDHTCWGSLPPTLADRALRRPEHRRRTRRRPRGPGSSPVSADCRPQGHRCGNWPP